ncbi:MAG: TlpA family protein disulfide reductase [Thermoguttaceae bacterium]|nr:TlpA family protein disulfide reductase [Thermoguttaceae bacterium]
MRSSKIMAALFILNAFMLVVAPCALSQDEASDAGLGSPCYVDEDGNVVCPTPGHEGPTDLTTLIPDAPQVDLTTQPWLVESANLPANSPVLKREHMIWADSFLWVAIEDVVDAIPVEKWLTKAPTAEDLKGKYVLVEMWATWCPPCRRSLPYLDFISKKYKDDLVVVSICEMDENAIRNMPGKGLNIFEIGYFAAVDTGRRLANKLGVYGIPHAILLEPTIGGIVWEGMPTLPRYELDDKKLERYFSIGRKLAESGRLPDESPIKFSVSEPSAEDRASRRRVSSKDSEDSFGAPTIEKTDE